MGYDKHEGAVLSAAGSRRDRGTMHHAPVALSCNGVFGYCAPLVSGLYPVTVTDASAKSSVFR